MKESGIHIVAFDVPYPADYGGVIEIFNKIKQLHYSGIRIHLHAYKYGRQDTPELLQYCEKVYYYKRSGLNALLSIRPYIVASRDSWELLANLKQNQWPILFEGLHTCFFLNHKSLNNRKKIVRLHNVEHHYYEKLANREINFFKKIFFRIEALKLRWFEVVLAYATHLLPISQNDQAYFMEKFPNKKITLIDPFIGSNEVTSIAGLGNHILYHGNLSVNENEEAATFLITHIFSKVNFPIVIAGKNPSKALQTLSSKHKHIQLVANPSRETMQQLVVDAQLHVLYTTQDTGIKLKLFSSLLHGRHCVVNSKMIAGTNVHSLCQVADESEATLKNIEELLIMPFTQNDIDQRMLFFTQHYNNHISIQKLLEIVFD